MSDIIDFTKLKELKSAEAKTEFPAELDTMKLGLDAFNEDMKTARSFIGITFDEDGSPRVTYGGDLNILEALGTLTIIQSEFSEYARNDFEVVDE